MGIYLASRRVALDERRGDGRRRRHHGELLLVPRAAMTDRRIAIGIDVGGSGVKAAAVDVSTAGDRRRAPPGAHAPAIDAGRCRDRHRPAGRAGRPGGRGAGRPGGGGRPERRHRRRHEDGRQRRCAAGSASTPRPRLTAAIGRPVLGPQRCRRRRPRRDALRGRRGDPRDGVRPDPRDRSRFGAVQRRQARPEHRARPHGDPRPGRRAAIGRDRAGPARPVMEGLGATDLDEHLHAIDRLFWPNLIILGGRRLEERRAVPAQPDGPAAGRAGQAPATTPGSSGRRWPAGGGGSRRDPAS